MLPLPSKDPPLREVGSSPPSDGPEWVAPVAGRRRRWLQIPVFVVLGCVLLWLVFMPLGHGDGSRLIRVTGHLVWSESGEPVAGARVLPVRARDLSRGWDPEEAWAWVELLNRARMLDTAPETDEDPPRGCGSCEYEGTRSTSDGTIGMTLELWTAATVHWFWTRESREEPQAAVAALWVAPEGREPVLVPIAAAAWRPTGAAGRLEVRGTYDLRTVALPSSDLRRR